MKEKFLPLLEKFRNIIQFWRMLSLIGKVNSIGMVSLPQFCTCSVFFAQIIFQKVGCSYSAIYMELQITQNKNREHLCKHRSAGGLSLSNFMHYYQITKISLLLDDTALLPEGLQMEREECLAYSIGAVLHSPVPLTGAHYNHNPVIHSTVTIWKQVTN